jgi:hypothetical protein
MINVNIIRIFKGPRHDRLEFLWKKFAEKHADLMTLHVFDNRSLRMSHDWCMTRMWEKEQQRPEALAIFTEFDFLPGPQFLNVKPECVAAAEYCTRASESRRMQTHGMPGAWFVAVNKELCGHLNFFAGGPFNDPCNELKAYLYAAEDCYPRHYGCAVKNDHGLIGEHLFWSRHYNDSPDLRPAGFDLGDIQAKVDSAISDWRMP